METRLTSGLEPGKGPIDIANLWEGDDEVTKLPCGREIAENERSALSDLLQVRTWGKLYSKIPRYTESWGYLLYRLCPMDRRFTGAIDKLERWMRYLVAQQRYAGLEPGNQDYLAIDEKSSLEGKMWPSRELAARFKFDIVHEIPDEDGDLRTGLDVPDGEDDFLPVGAAFVKWREENVNDPDPYAPNEHCIIVDEKCLAALEALPDQTPEPGPTDLIYSDMGLASHCEAAKAWVWILNREYYLRFFEFISDRESEVQLPPFEAGAEGEDRFEPWARIRLDKLLAIWFDIPLGPSPVSWDGCLMRDKEQWEAITWWEGAHANYENERMREERAIQPKIEGS
ncbi:hypothetical protein B0I35DRAFT_41354 [Stachybotrys elegans]|uniref:Uncharacterized protein n=1 Tax=Stachybotrys elegans TaxID=80388 RepID=A0A8K0T8H9_9HYPO|nr:hypothetical protein B0I35DRAFT_41354 [Stachybotrys elegans]